MHCVRTACTLRAWHSHCHGRFCGHFGLRPMMHFHNRVTYAAQHAALQASNLGSLLQQIACPIGSVLCSFTKKQHRTIMHPCGTERSATTVPSPYLVAKAPKCAETTRYCLGRAIVCLQPEDTRAKYTVTLQTVQIHTEARQLHGQQAKPKRNAKGGSITELRSMKE